VESTRAGDPSRRRDYDTVTDAGNTLRLLVTGFRPGPAGVGRVMMNLINGFARSAVEVHVLVGPGSYPELDSSRAGVWIHRVDMGGGASTIERLRQYLGDLAPHVALSNRDDWNALLVAAAAGMRDRPRIVLRVGIDVPAKLRRRSLLTRARRRRELTSVYRGADLLIGNSQGVCEGLRTLLGGVAPPILTICNPLDVARARRLARERPSHPWFCDRGYRLLVSVGRLARMKDHATLLRAFARLPSDFRLVVFGEGRQRSRLLALAGKLGVGDRFDLPGHIDNPFSHLAGADAFVLSSRFEGSPNALIESLAVGTPAVSTDCPSGPREILGQGLYGALVPVGDDRALARAIADTLERPPAAALLEEAVLRFDLDNAVVQYLRAMGLRCDQLPDSSGPVRPGSACG